MTYPDDRMVREHNLKVDNDLRQARLLYWQRLRGARNEYFNTMDPAPLHDLASNERFYKWMNSKYGIELHFVDGNISGAYTVTNQKKFTMFLLKYPG
jgi:hypothetical protein